MDNGRFRIRQACDMLNSGNIMPFPIKAEGIETATGKELAVIINKFIDDLESLPAHKEAIVDMEIKTLYNALCDGTVSFEPPQPKSLQNNNKDCISIDTDFLFFKRTIYYDESGRKIEEAD